MIDTRVLTSTISAEGQLRIALAEKRIESPAAGEVVVKIEAAPLNPTDLGLMIGPADVSTMRVAGTAEQPELVFDVPEVRLSAVAGRLGQSLPVGIEGAGVVVAAGAGARALEGKRVGLFGGGMFADYRKIKVSEVVPLPDQVSSADAAAMFVNPMTALGFVETTRQEGHGAIVHTAAASNLGQMLQKICLQDGISLVNIVRSKQQGDLLRGIGAKYVLNSNAPDFKSNLVDAIETTGATVAFDAVSGGTIGSDILTAMEQAALRKSDTYSQYGSGTFKQLYIYGRLDPSPTLLRRAGYGFGWSVSGWLLMPFLEKVGTETAARMRNRVIDELRTTFVSHYSQTIGLAEVLNPEVLSIYERKATGQKFLINPTLG